MHLSFYDKVDFNSDEKTAVSVRDGVLEYLGAELGLEPAEKLFKIYRSPATIGNVAFKMDGLPLCDGHIDVDLTVDSPMGHVKGSELIDLVDSMSNSQLAIKNKIQLKDRLFRIMATEGRELSLGYKARLVECQGKPYDFEQVDIEPRHLAIVDRGRCGHECRFLDTKQEIDEMKNKKSAKELLKKFLDEDGTPNLEEIVALATELPELLKKLPGDELMKIIPVLQGIKSQADNSLDPDNDGDAGGDMDGDGDGKKVEAEDTDDADDANDTKKTEDEDGTEEDEEEKKKVTDAAIKAAVREHANVTEKARAFLPEKYKFADKSAREIMRAVLEKEYPKEKFTDSELPVAFKTLRPKGTDVRKFGDKMPDGKGKFTSLKDKEL